MKSEELITRIEGQNRRLLWAAFLGALFLAIAFGFLAVQSLSVQGKLRQQLDDNKNQVRQKQAQNKAILERINKKADEQEAQLRCIAQLFTTQPPGTIENSDLTNCQVQSRQSPPTATNPTSASAGNSSASPKSEAATSKSNNSQNAGNPGNNPTPPPKAGLLQTLLNTLGL